MTSITNKSRQVLCFAWVLLLLLQAQGSRATTSKSGKSPYTATTSLPLLPATGPKGGYPYSPYHHDFKQTVSPPIQAGGPFDPTLAGQSSGLSNVLSLALPIICVVGIGVLLIPLIMGFLGSPSPLSLPWNRRRALGVLDNTFGGLLNKETVLEVLTTVQEALEAVDKKIKKN